MDEELPGPPKPALHTHYFLCTVVSICPPAPLSLCATLLCAPSTSSLKASLTPIANIGRQELQASEL